jgi:hypothetical protein
MACLTVLHCRSPALTGSVKHQSQNLVTSYFLYSVTAAPFRFVSGKFCDEDNLESL